MERLPFDTPAGPTPFALPADEGDPAYTAPGPEPSEDEAAEGPGDETLTRLSREAESIDLNTVFPKAEPASVPFALAAEEDAERRRGGGGAELQRPSRTTRTPS